MLFNFLVSFLPIPFCLPLEFLIIFLKLSVIYLIFLSHSVMSDSLRPHSPWNSPGQNTGVGSLSLLQGIFPTQGSNPALLHCRWILYQLSHMGRPRILEWVAYPFFSRSSQPRNQTGVSWIAGGLFFLPTELWWKPLTSQGHTQWKVSMLGLPWWSSG